MHHVKKFGRVSWTAEWVKAFVAAVHEEREPEVSFREGWENLAFIESAYRSLDARHADHGSGSTEERHR